jgi:hypothetical protein
MIPDPMYMIYIYHFVYNRRFEHIPDTVTSMQYIKKHGERLWLC